MFYFSFIAIVIAITLTDIKLAGRNLPSIKHSILKLTFWIVSSLLFCLVIYFYQDSSKALEFLTGYLIELSLSVDNIFVFIVIFSYFNIPLNQQNKILLWGILSAIFMRLAMIYGGILIINKFMWMFYIFGIILIVSSFKILKFDFNNRTIDSNIIIKFLKRFNCFTINTQDDKFIIVKNGRKFLTHYFVALIMIEQTDLIFALDSIPAILAITNDPFIVFTSNIFAILGLRSMYFLLQNMVHRYAFLKYGISAILLFIGIKMILPLFTVHISTQYSLAFILIIFVITIISSLYFAKQPHKKKQL